jgi:hypothetical protein
MPLRYWKIKMKTILEEVIHNLKEAGFKDLVRYDKKGVATSYELGDAIENHG